MKTACLSGAIPADGLLLAGHGNCSGCVEWFGHIAFCPAGRTSPSDEAAKTDRLLSGRAADNTGVQATAQDWTTYKANNSRSGSSSAAVPDKVTTVWTWTPKNPFDYKAEIEQGLELESTQPICVGERVFCGTAAGSVYCLDRKTGKELWSFPTAGRIVSAPTFWEGKLYVGSGDGRVYCLNAADGSLAWRYRVAPVERRIMVYSHLMSAWPVNANVLVEPSTFAGKSGAVAYASAGLIGPFGGTYNTDSTIFLNGREEMRANRYGVHLTGDISLAAGNHAIAISCHCSGTGSEKLTMRWQRPGKNKPEDIDATCLLHGEIP